MHRKNSYPVEALRWERNACLILDQTRLPSEEIYLKCTRYPEVVSAIKVLAVRGAPAIGIAGAYGCVLALQEALEKPASERASFFETALTALERARPTAVNLGWAVTQMRNRVQGRALESSLLTELTALAVEIEEDDRKYNHKMAEFGAALMPARGSLMTICNTGDLCTGGGGTAFGVIREAYRQGKVEQVYPCETRPVLQGLRLTVWELQKNEIPYSAICDSMAADLMKRGKVSAVLAGADRVVANGDSANKIGTYSLAVLAHFHKIPFYIVAPSSSFDLKTATGEGIPIEQRHSEEIVGVLSQNRHPQPVQVYNPSFDVTPAELISAIVCEKGVIHRPTAEKVKALFGATN